MTEFMRWLEAERGLSFPDYDALWRWSVDDLDGFWRAIWDFFDVQADGDPSPVLASREMPGARWFPNVCLNYAEHVFAGKDDEQVAILHSSELRELGELRWGELRAQVAAVAAGLRAMGVRRGDRVVAYLPNIPEAIVAFLATASIGAVWSSCSPDFGPASVVDRFAQIEPRVLFAVDGYRYGGKDFDRTETVAALREAMPSLEHTVLVPYLDPGADPAALGEDATTWARLLADGEGAELGFERVPFDHPLWVLYSSGTTGLPKAIVQGQGGILLEHLKKLGIHVDAHPGDRLFWFTTTGWMMWNFLVSGLLTEAAIVLYDGNPGHPDMNVLWDLAERAGVTMFGTSASYISACMKAGVEPGSGRDLGALTAVGSTGSPLSPEGFDWIYEQIGADTWLFSTSGGTDVCTAFVGGVALLPVYRGEIQARALGCAVEAWDEDGQPLTGAVGELVITEPMPSMPVFFWGDEDGGRYRESYFEMYPGVWRHGDTWSSRRPPSPRARNHDLLPLPQIPVAGDHRPTTRPLTISSDRSDLIIWPNAPEAGPARNTGGPGPHAGRGARQVRFGVSSVHRHCRPSRRPRTRSSSTGPPAPVAAKHDSTISSAEASIRRTLRNSGGRRGSMRAGGGLPGSTWPVAGRG